MKSIKRGRGPSFMGVIGAIIAVVFILFWMGAASSIGAPPIFLCFGLLGIGVAVINGIYDLRNATGKKRYSEYDIVDSEEESDPLNEVFCEPPEEAPSGRNGEEYGFCPYCGTKREQDHVYCGKCGKRIG